MAAADYYLGIRENIEAGYELAVTYSGLVGMFLGSTFFAIKVYTEYTRYTAGALTGNDARIPLDWNEIVRLLFLILVLVNFKTVADGVRGTIREINSVTEKGGSNHEALAKSFNESYIASVVSVYQDRKAKLTRVKESIANNPDIKNKEMLLRVVEYELGKNKLDAEDDLTALDGTDDGSGITNGDIQKVKDETAWYDISEQLTQACIGAVMWISWAAKGIIGGFAMIVFYLGLTYGPLALAFGMLNKQLPINYVGMLLNWGLVFTTINLLDLMVYGYLRANSVNPDKSQALCFFIIMIAAYFSAFKITKWFMAFGGLNQLMNAGIGKTAGIVATGAAIAVGGTMMAGGASAGSASRGAGYAGGAANKGGNSSRLD